MARTELPVRAGNFVTLTSRTTVACALTWLASSTDLFAQGPTRESRARVVSADSSLGVGPWSTSVSMYRSALALDPSDGQSAHYLGIALYKDGDYVGAAAAESTFAARNPALRATGLYYWGRALAMSGRREEAARILQRAVASGYRTTRSLVTDTAFNQMRRMPEFVELTRRIFGPYYGTVIAGPPSASQMADGVRAMVGFIRSEHPNPYRYWSRGDWDSQVEAVVARTPRMNEAEYLVELMRLACSVGDVHTSAFASDRSPLMKRFLPVGFWKFPEGLYIRVADSAHRDLIGARVVKIGSQTVDSLWPRLIRQFPFENEWMSAGEMQYYLGFPDFVRGIGASSDSTKLALRLRFPDQTERTVTIDAIDQTSGVSPGDLRGFTVPKGWVEGGAASAPLWLSDRKSNYWMKEIAAAKAVYVQFSLPRDDPGHPWPAFLDSMVATVRRTGAERLIIDLRHNPGGWAYMAADLVRALHRVPAVDQPGHTFVLISRVTQSAGVSIAAELERNADAVFVGEPLAAHPNFFNGPMGNHVPQSLPGAALAYRVSNTVQQHSDALDFRRFIAPDIPAPLGWNDFLRGTDPALDAALRIPVEQAARLLDDDGGRALPTYFRFNRPTQFLAWGSASDHPVP